MDELAHLSVGVSVPLGGLRSGLGLMKGMVAGAAGAISASLTGAFAVAGGIGIAKGVGAVVSGLYNMVSQGIAFNAQMETMKAGFEVMLGSADKATTLMGQLQEFAKATPFEMPQLANLATQLLATKKVGQDELLPMMKKLGDAASGSAEGFAALPRVGRAIAQMFGKGKIQAEEMNQLAEAGIPAWQALAAATGKTEAELRALAQQGKLGDDAIRALIEGLGKQFEGMAEKQSKTFSGMWSTFKDAANIALGKISTPIFERLKKGMAALVEFMDSPAFSEAIDRIGAGIEYVMQLIEMMIPSIVSGIQLAVDAVQWFMENWRMVFEYVQAQSEATSQWLYEQLIYTLNERLPFAMIALWDGFVAGAKAATDYIAQIFVSLATLVKSIFEAIAQSVSVRMAAMGKALELVKQGRLGDALDALVQGEVQSAAGLGVGVGAAAKQFAESTAPIAGAIGKAAGDAMGETLSKMPDFKPSERLQNLQKNADQMGRRLGESWEQFRRRRAAAAVEEESIGDKIAREEAGGEAAAIAEEEKKRKVGKAEFVGLTELNKRFQQALGGDQEAKDRKAQVVAVKEVAKNTKETLDINKKQLAADEKMIGELKTAFGFGP
jgi:tape measure domain-containing protein